MTENSIPPAKLGVIGGLGTDTAAQFYVIAEKLWTQHGQTSHIPLLLENCRHGFALEQSCVTSLDQIDALAPFLIAAARSLVDGGATLIALPCNTAHVHIAAVRRAIPVSVLSITEVVATALTRRGVKKVGILGTRVTRDSLIYEKACAAKGIQVIYPDETDQLSIEQVIQHALAWTNDEKDTKALQEVLQRLRERDAEMSVLACTDLQLCLPKPRANDVLDSMETLAEASVKMLVEQVKA